MPAQIPAKKERKKARDRAYYRAHRAEKSVYGKQWRKEHKHELREYYYGYRLELKLLTFSHYGIAGKCQCCWPGCDVTDLDMLSLDHVANDGNIERKSTGVLGGYPLYVRLKRDGFPEGFQTLCLNHQMKKAILLLRERKGRL